MKIITEKEQIIPGMVVNVYSKTDGIKLMSNGIVENIDPFDEIIFVDGKKIWLSENNTLIIVELVSYPERRRISKEWVVENLDKIPGLKLWDIFDIEKEITSIRGQGVFDVCENFYSYDDAVYIDPPHTVVEDVTPPWEVEKVEEEDPWVEITKDHVVKMPCDALFANFDESSDSDNKSEDGKLITIIPDCEFPYKGITNFWKYCKVRKSSIISSPTDKPYEPDDTVRRLWWYGEKNGEKSLTSIAYTEKQLLKLIGINERYAPGPIVPPESEWREVK